MIQRLNFSEQIVTVTENLYAGPTELLAEEIQDVPDGMVCLVLPNQGYALAKVATIIIRMPESDELGIKGRNKDCCSS
jgi:hypothetical protein